MPEPRTLDDIRIQELRGFVQTQDAVAYYTRLEELGYGYATLAKGVVTGDDLSGRFANTFLAEVALDQGVNVTEHVASLITQGLMEADFQLRTSGVVIQDADGFLTDQQIEDYHRDVFEIHGISIDAWTAHLPLKVWEENYQELGFSSPGEAREHAWNVMVEEGITGQGEIALKMAVYAKWGVVTDEASLFLALVGAGLPNEQAAVWFDKMKAILIDEGAYLATFGSPFPPDECFAAGTPIAMADGSSKPIEHVRVGDEVLAYDTADEGGAGALAARRVTQTFATPERLILDFHGLKVTPGHVFLCGEGDWAGKHRMLIDILREDGSIVGADGVSRRAATNCPVGSEGDRFVELAYIVRADEREHRSARIRAGTLLIDEAGEARSVLQCLEAEGYSLRDDGLVQKPGEEPGALRFFGTPPKPEDYVLQRSGLTLAEIAGNTGYQPRPAAPWGGALASGWTPDSSKSGEADRELFLSGLPARNTAGETLH